MTDDVYKGSCHPGLNPQRSPGKGQSIAIRTDRLPGGRVRRVISVCDQSRWIPHGGVQEAQRRVRQREALERKRAAAQ